MTTTRPLQGWAAVGAVLALILTATSFTMPAAAASSAHAVGLAALTPCNANDYDSRVRKVKGGDIVIKLSHVEEFTYPGRTVFKRNTGEKTKAYARVASGLSGSAKGKVGGSGVLKKILKIYGEASGEYGFTSKKLSVTRSKVKTKTRTKLVIPRATTVAWYRGFTTVRGTAKVSYCDAINGTGDGTVKWLKAKWKSFGHRGQGGQRCDKDAQGKVAAAAKKVVCT